MAEDQHTDFRIRRADWAADAARLTAIRRQVFVREQQVPEALEWDGLDSEALHLLAEDADGAAIGTARLLSSGQIGRMAVLAEHRRQGVGRALLRELLRIAEDEGRTRLFLNAQVSALPFYAGLGFEAEGEVFEEAGIPHRRMHFVGPKRVQPADLRDRRLGTSAGVLRFDTPNAQSSAVMSLAGQARSELLITSPDLEPALYDQAPMLDTMMRLAIHRRGRVPVRVLVADAQAPLKRGHRLIELSRRFSSAIQIRCIPEELADGIEPCMLADEVGYTMRPTAAHDTLVMDFADGGITRRLRRRFELLWQRSGVHPGLRRLYL